MEEVYGVAVVGGGIAGYTAALTLKNLKVNAVWFGGKSYGEKLEKAEKVTNFPAFSGSGKEFSVRLEAQRKENELVRTEKRIDGIYALGEKFLLTSGKESFYSYAVILATGVEYGSRFKGEAEFLGRGVSYCAVCDGALYRGKRVALIAAAPQFEEEAFYLATFAREVLFVPLYQGGTVEGERIKTLSRRPEEIMGGARVEKLRFSDGEEEVDGVFILRESQPPAALAGGLTTEGEKVPVSRKMETNLKGLFAAGDVTGRPYQYVKAAGEGSVAAYSAAEYLREIGRR